MFKGLEISIHSNNELLVDYKKLTKNSIKIYNVAVISLAMLDLAKLNKGVVSLNGWKLFGINPLIIFIPLGIMLGSALIKNIIDAEEFSLETILRECMWLLVALLPGIIGLLLWMSDFKIFM